jgi:ABC-2 type transport system ATP-binding protein
MLAISVENLTVEYRRPFSKPLAAVSGLSFSVEAGEIVGFLGVNGAGKTSTIKAVMGFTPPAGGQVSVFGFEAGSIQAKRKVGFLPETAMYSPYLTPLETMNLYADLHGISASEKKEMILELLERVGICEKRNAPNKQLSKGMLQRLGIAQALLGSPELLVLDEVSSGLDPIGRRDLRNVLNEERQRGTTVFFSSHNLGEVELLCDRILIIHKGKLVVENKIEAIRNRVDSLEEYFVSVVEGHFNPTLEHAA